MKTNKIDFWVVIELMGKTKIAGQMTEELIGGVMFLRVDVPENSKQPAFTKYFSAGAIWAITPISKEVALAMSEVLISKPLDVWDISQVNAKLQICPPKNPFFDNEDEDLNYSDDDY